jgi:hypothetical protein
MVIVAIVAVKERSWDRWTGSTAEIVELYREAGEILEDAMAQEPRKSFILQYKDGARSLSPEDSLERKLRARYRNIEKIEIQAWVESTPGEGFPKKSDFEDKSDSQPPAGWSASAVGPPVGIEITFDRTSGSRLLMLSSNSSFISLAFDEIEGLVALGQRSRLAKPFEWGLGTGLGVLLLALVGCTLGFSISHLPLLTWT